MALSGNVLAFREYCKANGFLGATLHTFYKLHERISHRYEKWYATHGLNDEKLEKQRNYHFANPLHFSIVVPTYNTQPILLRALVQSVLNQSYRYWELCLYDGGSVKEETLCALCEMAHLDERIHVTLGQENLNVSGNTNQAIAMATGDYIVFSDHDDLLTPDALFEVMNAIERTGAELIYSDEDKTDESGTRYFSPHFKPDYSPEYLRTNNYISHLCVISKTLLQKTGLLRSVFDGSQDHDLVLRASEIARCIVHIPKVLYHWRMLSSSLSHGATDQCTTASQLAVKQQLERLGFSAKVEKANRLLRVCYELPTTIPTISIVVLGRECGSKEKSALESGFHSKIQWIRADARHCSWTAAANKAAQNAEGDYLFFWDPAFLPVTANALRSLFAYAQQEDVGCVGPMLVKRFGNIYAAGYAVSQTSKPVVRRDTQCLWRHGHLWTNQYIQRCAHEVSAVPAEALLIRKQRFLQLGGFCENYQRGFADAELCLKALDMKWRNLAVPEVVFQWKAHLWTKTIVTIADQQESELFLKRNEQLTYDPYAQPALDAYWGDKGLPT